MTTTFVFALSIFIATALVLIKSLELRHGKKNVFLRIIGKFDFISLFLASVLKFRTLQLVQSLRYVVIVRGKTVCKEWLEKIKVWILEEFRMRRDEIMGHKDIINKGSVSFYLKKITENKEGGIRGKIE